MNDNSRMGWVCPRCDRAHSPGVAGCNCHAVTGRGQLGQIIAACASEFGVTVEDVTGPSRRREYVRPRHAAMWMARVVAGLSLHQVGRAFGRDHTSVINAVERVDRADPELRAAIGRVRQRIDPEARRERIVVDTMDRAQIAALGRAAA
jgi:hypothetical protein